MRQRLAIVVACALVALCATAVPALAAHNHRAKTTTTASSSAHHKASAKATHHHAAASSATTAAANKVLNDCQSHGQLTHAYPRADLEKALTIMSASTKQYSNCSDVIHQALAHGIKVSDVKGSGGSGGSTTTIVIIVVVVLLLLAAIFGGLAVRRRRGDGGDGGAPAPSGS